MSCKRVLVGVDYLRVAYWGQYYHDCHTDTGRCLGSTCSCLGRLEGLLGPPSVASWGRVKRFCHFPSSLQKENSGSGTGNTVTASRGPPVADLRGLPGILRTHSGRAGNSPGRLARPEVTPGAAWAPPDASGMFSHPGKYHAAGLPRTDRRGPRDPGCPIQNGPSVTGDKGAMQTPAPGPHEESVKRTEPEPDFQHAVPFWGKP